ncbi:MAG: GDP-mannose 4,6-dehydratase [Candidatus Omnitrophica bacterium]|nr:GDP-mannose 4,6-dehydratase [Candidatus Omnitrophota bacterium]
MVRQLKLNRKKILITGGSGFIGSHLVEGLVKSSAKVRILVPYSSNRNEENLIYLDKEIRKRIEVVFGNIVELETVKDVMKGIDIAFNLAALVGIPYSYVHPREVFEVNAIGTLNMLTAAKELKIERFIQTSTSEVYGTARYVPIDEKHPLQPQSPYSASKISADAMAMSFHYSFDLPVVIVRPFNTFGPRQSERAVIPTIISQALTQDKILIGSTRPRRDFTYVKDAIQGFIKAAEAKSSIGEVINLGTGRDHSIEEIINIIGRLLGKKLRIIAKRERKRPSKSEVMRLRANNKKAKKFLYWAPKYSFMEGLKETIDFISDNIKRYEPRKYVI